MSKAKKLKIVNKNEIKVLLSRLNFLETNFPKMKYQDKYSTKL